MRDADRLGPAADGSTVDLSGITLVDARTGAPVAVAAHPGVIVLSLIRHRF